ncbi:MAG: aspartate aminotransferase family protein [Desulfobacterales bacterium]|jgi:adenosylmethionine-8-amino-7-oxononanoate aminotransferase
MDQSSHLILHLTPKTEVEKGITVISRGEGVHVFDSEGKKYIDLVAGVTRPVHLGYGNTELAQAIYDQMMELAYFTPLMFANEPAIKLAEVLSEITPGAINRFTFECGGSEAVETAMKLAKHYHYFKGDKGRYKVLSRKGAYHGVNGIGVRALGSVVPMRQMMEPLAPGSVFAESPYCYRCPYNLTYPDCDIVCARNIEHIIEFEGSEHFTAIIGEPIQQGFGALAPPKEYWPIIRDICDKFGILLIIDEVICGFGRTGKMFATEHFDVQPDMMTMAKGITSGYIPLGAVGVTDAVMEPIEVFSHLHTYGNHPVSSAAGVKTIEILQRENLVEASENLGKYFLEGLQELESHSIVGEIRGTGLWTAIDFTVDKKTRAPLPAEHLGSMIERAKKKGLIIKPAPVRQALEFAPALTIQKEEIDEAIKILEACISEEEKEMGI